MHSQGSQISAQSTEISSQSGQISEIGSQTSRMHFPGQSDQLPEQ